MQKQRVGNYTTFFFWLRNTKEFYFNEQGQFIKINCEETHYVKENRNGYFKIYFYFLGHRFEVMEHIAYFIYKTGIWPKKGEQINHKDMNRGNNHIDNLEVMTQSENLKHAYFARRSGIKGGKR